VKWYFAIDEGGGLGATGEDAKTAVRSARLVGGLEPHLLYYGARSEFTVWMEKNGVTVIDTAPSFTDTIRQAEADGVYKAHSIGHWLRVAVPLVEQEREFVLYTDCDVIFLKRVNWDLIRPKVFAAAPEFKPDNWNYFNAGVMVLNVPYMRATYPAFEAHCIKRIMDPDWFQYDDEVALNEAYRGLWDRLDPRLNWKPYWGYKSDAALLHSHGPKLDVVEAMTEGRWTDDNPTALQLGKMVDGRIDFYIAWLRQLGDELQAIDMKLALRMHKAASGLIKRKAGMAGQVLDMGFMDFCMFV
jgi:hypothetical protein